MKISRDGIEAFCCNVDKGEEKSDNLPLAPSSEKLIESIPQEANACDEKVTSINDDLLLGDTLHNRLLYLVGYMRDERINRILVDGGSSVNILPIRIVKELGIPMSELSESRVMIQGFNQRGKRSIGAIRLEITIEDMQSSAWLHGEVEKKIVADDEPFTEAESHFADAKFYLKNHIVKEIKVDDGMKRKNDEPTTKRAEVTIGKAKAITEEVHTNVNKSHKGDIAYYGKKVSLALQYVLERKKDEGESSNLQTHTLKDLTLPVKRIELVKLSLKPLAGFVAQNHLQNLALPTKRTYEGFDSNAYKLFAKGGYNPNEPSKSTEGKAIYCGTKERDEDEESVGSSYHVTVQGENGVPSSMEDNAELEDVSPCYHTSFNYGDPQEDEDAKDDPPKLEEGVKATVDALKELTLIEAGFIREVKYPTWVSSIVSVRKKNGQIRVCVDFRDLNNACPKDEFPLPIPELMIDVITRYEAMSFMDGSSGYNQIRMAPKDEELTVFCTPKGIYYYNVMPFGLKNAGATYQRAMQNIHLLHKNVKCYVDDLVVKSREKGDHLKDLRMVFELLRRYQLRMNPLKCVFGVTSRKFLGFIVRHRGIEIDQAKVDAILKMPEPWDIHELKSLQGKLAYLRRFISDLAGRCQPFSRLMKKGFHFKWDQTCTNAFESIKSYLMKPPILAAHKLGKPLILYISAQERSVGALLAQENSEGKENSLYYLSKMMTPNELNYSPIQAHVVRLVSKANPIKFVMSKLVLNDRLARWYLQFQQFKILYIPQKAVKGKALEDFLADHPIPDDWELTDELPDEDAMVIEVQPLWKMYFDGAAHRRGAGAGVVFITSQGEVLPNSFTLMQLCSNNVTKYQALILGLEMAVEMKLLQLQIFGDS
ncbi:uncharacterized protein [Nicotiana sylvestris]|uniref:uncharacterized protein n=1 Tax=Nicotiana sylvestris TaxID=4096 RepID=UPI00388CE43A